MMCRARSHSDVTPGRAKFHEELAHTVDTIAGRLDPKRVAKRGVGAVRDGLTTVVDGARVKLHLMTDALEPDAAQHAPDTAETELPSVAKAKFAQVAPIVKRVPKPAAAGGMAALVAMAAIIAVRRSRR